MDYIRAHSCLQMQRISHFLRETLSTDTRIFFDAFTSFSVGPSIESIVDVTATMELTM